MLFLWQVYTDNIDSFIKILHAPTVSNLIRALRGGYEHLGLDLKAFLLAIAFAAVVSLKDQEVGLCALQYDETDRSLLGAIKFQY